jgi:hypothetical protein
LACSLIALPGEFQDQLHLFLDDNGLREITLSVRGRATNESGVAAGQAANGKLNSTPMTP